MLEQHINRGQVRRQTRVELGSSGGIDPAPPEYHEWSSWGSERCRHFGFLSEPAAGVPYRRTGTCRGISGDNRGLLTRAFADRWLPMPCSWSVGIWVDVWVGFRRATRPCARGIRRLCSADPSPYPRRVAVRPGVVGRMDRRPPLAEPSAPPLETSGWGCRRLAGPRWAGGQNPDPHGWSSPKGP